MSLKVNAIAIKIRIKKQASAETRKDSAITSKEDLQRTVSSIDEFHDGHEGERLRHQHISENKPHHALQQDRLHFVSILPAPEDAVPDQGKKSDQKYDDAGGR